MRLLLAIALLCGSPIARAEDPITRLACGSCYKPAKDVGLWEIIGATKPQLFLFMGDNIYADTEDTALMRARYDELRKQPGYLAFRKQCPVLPIWDDHDYGANDAGADYPKRQISQVQFLDNFEFAADHPARATPGVYHSWIGGPPGKRLQIILLDTRYFRSPIKVERINNRKTIVPNTNPGSTILGHEQWTWLEAELRKPADLRVLVSSIQIITTEHRFEKWSNFPHDRTRLFKLLAATKAQRVVLFSGDRHLAEIARIAPEQSGVSYPLIELTSSGMTHAGAPEGANRHRVGPCVSEINFATMKIDWEPAIPEVALTIHNRDGKSLFEHRVTFPR
ncbi:MAG: alkaline phosphatase D family protein [Akkermansiaceae bacterium]